MQIVSGTSNRTCLALSPLTWSFVVAVSLNIIIATSYHWDTHQEYWSEKLSTKQYLFHFCQHRIQVLEETDVNLIPYTFQILWCATQWPLGNLYVVWALIKPQGPPPRTHNRSACSCDSSCICRMICIVISWKLFSIESLVVNSVLLEAAGSAHHPPAVLSLIHLWPGGLFWVGQRLSSQLNHLLLAMLWRYNYKD